MCVCICVCSDGEEGSFRNTGTGSTSGQPRTSIYTADLLTLALYLRRLADSHVRIKLKLLLLRDDQLLYLFSRLSNSRRLQFWHSFSLSPPFNVFFMPHRCRFQNQTVPTGQHTQTCTHNVRAVKHDVSLL